MRDAIETAVFIFLGFVAVLILAAVILAAAPFALAAVALYLVFNLLSMPFRVVIAAIERGKK